MSRTYQILPWKRSPFIRLLLPFIAGIMLQYYLAVGIITIIVFFSCFFVVLILFSLLPLALRYHLRAVPGFILNIILAALGAWISWQQDIRHNGNWYGNFTNDSSYVTGTIIESPREKKTYKALVQVEKISDDSISLAVTGKLLCYFSKDSFSQSLKYGDRILIHKKLQQIKNSGNPGAFNYREYAAFQGLYHDVFLQSKDWVSLKVKNSNPFNQFLISTRGWILSVLKKYCGDNKDELGIAEALLIGYTDDLDKDIVQAYSSTGVVHIIAISGMHLALIYLLLVLLFSHLPGLKKSKLSQVILILSCLWLFSLLTGGSASVLRSAVMFTSITIGKNFVRKTSIYNSLAASAFVLLCYNPYFLWDVGFQLSYLALIGIVMFQKPISGLIFIKNKWLDQAWQLVAVSIAAQIFTFPICIYYFHQFPLLFLFANLVAVPLSGIILYAEMALIVFSWLPYVRSLLGLVTSWLVSFMNKLILGIGKLSFAVWDQIPATIFSTILLYVIVIAFGDWLLNKRMRSFHFGFLGVLMFVICSSVQCWHTLHQKKIIVYNVARHAAMDLVTGNRFEFVGDSAMTSDLALQQYNLKPSRILFQAECQGTRPGEFFQTYPFCQFLDKTILLVDSPLRFAASVPQIDIDLVVISKNPKLSIAELARVFKVRQFVFDASNTLWKIEKWKRECSLLNLPCYSVPDQGAFVFTW